mgnify:FL=1
MYRYILKRILSMIPVLLGVTIIVFTLMYISPGSPAAIMLGTEATPEGIAKMEEEMGLNDPYLVRLGRYIAGVVTRFDLGDSYRTKSPVRDEVFKRLGVTLKLAMISMVIGTILGMILGIISAVKQYSWMDRISTIFALLGISMPSFFLALMLILIFSLGLGWFPVSGSYSFKYWVLPTATLGLQAAGIVMRMTRSSMLESIRKDYIRTARAKGQNEWNVIIKHALRNALIPVITVVGNQLSILIGGAVLVESVFSLPGLGKYLIDGINNLDYPVVQGSVLVIGFMSVFIMLIVDIIYSFVDPRLKSMYQTTKKKAPAVVKEKE